MKQAKEQRFHFLNLALCALLVVCGTSIGFSNVAAAQMPETEDDTDMTMAADTVQIQVARDAELGPYLTDADGRALYLFKADTSRTSTCYEKCAEVWPPLLTEGTPRAADSAVQEKLLGTIQRKDGAMQVTYNGWPLYYFAKDTGAGDTRGQDIMGFGAEWYLVSPSGREVHAESKGEGHDSGSGQGGASGSSSPEK